MMFLIKLQPKIRWKSSRLLQFCEMTNLKPVEHMKTWGIKNSQPLRLGLPKTLYLAERPLLRINLQWPLQIKSQMSTILNKRPHVDGLSPQQKLYVENLFVYIR